MSFSQYQLASVFIGYLGVLFFTAYGMDRGWLPKKWVKAPVTYVLSLGVYASAWAFYGSVSLADQFGLGFLTYYLGISAAFIFAPVLLKPLLRIIHNYQLSSLADLLAFRYRSRLAGILVTLLMLTVTVPIVTMQITAAADTLYLLNDRWSLTSLAGAYGLTMTIFAVLFGARHVSSREKHDGLIFAIAVETLIKLLAIVILAVVASFVVIQANGGVSQWLVQLPRTTGLMQAEMTDGPWWTLMLLFFAAAVVMPHMFQMIFTENINPKALKTARWGMPAMMLILAMCVLPILEAGRQLDLVFNVEYYALAIGIALESPTLTLITLVGGLAAASGVIIVSTLATAAMLQNHIVLAFYRPPQNRDIYRWLLWVRRGLIAVILFAAYGFYRMVGTDLNLGHLGILAFVAAVQFFPGVVALLYWPTANKKGFISGLVAGFSCWTLLMLIPLSEQALGFSFPISLPHVDEDNWHLAALAAIGSNLLLFIVVSLLSRQKVTEVTAAEACSIDTVSRPNRRPMIAANSNEVIDALAAPLRRYVAEREVFQALMDLGLPSFEDRPYALRQLRAQLEANLSGLMGPIVSHEIIQSHLPLREEREVVNDIHQIEQRLEGFHDRLGGIAGELDNLRRYHRQTLQKLPMGVCSLAADGEVLMWNQAMVELTGIAAEDVTGSHTSALPTPWSQLISRFVESDTMHEHKYRIDQGARPTWYNLHKSVMESYGGGSGGVVILVEDQTETQLLEDELIHSERLASIGRLAAGVAHEIGNPMTGIDCIAQSIRYETDNPVLLDMSKQIQEQTKRVMKIVQSLVNFSHAGHHTQRHDPVFIDYCVDEAMHLLQLNKTGIDISFENQCTPGLQVLGDASRLVQVFVNLLSNAQDASQHGQGIIVDTQADEQQVTIRVIDQGEGVDSSVVERVFEPFFTTKDVGKGTGLGLALVYSIIDEHYGNVTLKSPWINGCGTCVIIQLPRFIDQNEMENEV